LFIVVCLVFILLHFVNLVQTMILIDWMS